MLLLATECLKQLNVPKRGSGLHFMAIILQVHRLALLNRTRSPDYPGRRIMMSVCDVGIKCCQTDTTVSMKCCQKDDVSGTPTVSGNPTERLGGRLNSWGAVKTPPATPMICPASMPAWHPRRHPYSVFSPEHSRRSRSQALQPPNTRIFLGCEPQKA